MTLQDDLVTLASVKLLSTRLGVIEAETKAAIKNQVGGRMGSTAAVLPDGTEAATVWITKPTQHRADPGGTAYVSNPALFTAWAESVRPDTIVKSVRSTDVDSLLAFAMQTLETSGELPPGIDLTEPKAAYQSGGGNVSIKQSDEQAANLLRQIIDGLVPLPMIAGRPIVDGEEEDHEG